MEGWADEVHGDHRALASQADALNAALTIDVNPRDRRVVLSWIIRTVWPALELHLRKEEEVLFPALQHLLGEEAGALQLLKEQNRELRASHRRLAELLQGYEDLDWEGIKLASYSFMELLEDHEKNVNRLLLDVLSSNLKPQELKTLREAYARVAKKAHEEEGWPTLGTLPPRRSTRLSEPGSRPPRGRTASIAAFACGMLLLCSSFAWATPLKEEAVLTYARLLPIGLAQELHRVVWEIY